MIEGKETNAKWAREFLEKLNACNAECGVIFSQPVYESFHEYRTALMEIERKSAAGEAITGNDLAALVKITTRHDGLGARLKADLGSYIDAIFRQQEGLNIMTLGSMRLFQPAKGRG